MVGRQTGKGKNTSKHQTWLLRCLADDRLFGTLIKEGLLDGKKVQGIKPGHAHATARDLGPHG